MKNDHWGLVMLSSSQNGWLQCKVRQEENVFFQNTVSATLRQFIDWWHHPAQNSVTTKNPVPPTTAIQLLCPQEMGNKTTGEAENALSSARRINYGAKTLFNSVDSTGKDVLIPTSVPTLRYYFVLHIRCAHVTLIVSIISLKKC